jgi:hypothetical protein
MVSLHTLCLLSRCHRFKIRQQQLVVKLRPAKACRAEECFLLEIATIKSGCVQVYTIVFVEGAQAVTPESISREPGRQTGRQAGHNEDQ